MFQFFYIIQRFRTSFKVQKNPATKWLRDWQGKKASNPRPTVLETVALPTELFPYMIHGMVGLQGLEPGTDRL